MFGERYQAQHSDRVISLESHSNPADWLHLHEEIVDTARTAARTPRPRRAAATDPAVTVVMAYFNHGRYFVETLRSLEQQTTQRFTVIAVDDGSTSAHSRSVFDEMRARYQTRGWRFLAQARAGGGAARNFGARQARSEYLMFFDADDIASPHFVGRLLEAAEYSGDDALTAWQYKFRDNRGAYDFDRQRMLTTPYLLYTPPGNDPPGNLMNNMHGGVVCVVRRDVFLAAGGFPEQWSAWQDYMLHMRIALAGYSNDIVPEFLCYNRNTPGSVSKTLPTAANSEFIRQAVDRTLHPLGLSQLSLAFRALVERNQVRKRS